MTISDSRQPILIEPDAGRVYDMGRIQAVFKADGSETANRYSISEWWLEPYTQGPGAHSHGEDDVFYVLEGIMSFLIGETWQDFTKGGFVLVPSGTVHDFENRGSERAGVLNISVPGAFEGNMPSIVEWFAKHPPGNTE
ncbi:MAG: cupin domain-containing protein [Alphaproteobacteria bacterium]|nr:cupin domain-containing protein [Alphaproteobacteria bacterium]